MKPTFPSRPTSPSLTLLLPQEHLYLCKSRTPPNTNKRRGAEKRVRTGQDYSAVTYSLGLHTAEIWSQPLCPECFTAHYFWSQSPRNKPTRKVCVMSCFSPLAQPIEQWPHDLLLGQLRGISPRWTPISSKPAPRQALCLLCPGMPAPRNETPAQHVEGRHHICKC